MFTLLIVLVYLTAINLGLPDSVLGASWPVLSEFLGVSEGSLGIISLIVSGFTIFTSFFSGKIIKRFGNGKVIVFSIALTCVSVAAIGGVHSFFWLVFFSVPLGLGGGAVDTSMNDYVARNCSTRQLSWLHCFWGVGALTGPLVMSQIIKGGGWQWGYYSIAIFQAVSLIALIIFLPLWDKFDNDKHKPSKEGEVTTNPSALTQNTTNAPEGAVSPCPAEAPLTKSTSAEGAGKGSPQVSALRKNKSPLASGDVWLSMLCFFMYCGGEALTGSWGATYLFQIRGFTADSAAFAVSLYFLGITLGRFLLGFIADKVGDKKLIYGGIVTVLVASVLLLFAVEWKVYYFVALFLVGLGCAPTFPCMVHLTPTRFPKEFSAQIIGFQIGAAGLGIALVPPVLGFVGDVLSYVVYPIFLCFCNVALILLQLLLNYRLRNKLGAVSP